MQIINSFRNVVGREENQNDIQYQRRVVSKAHKILSFFYEGLTFDINDITFDPIFCTITLDVPLKNQKLGRNLLEWAIKEAK